MAKKILLIEDEELLLGLLQERLKKEGYEMYIAKDGLEGLAAMRRVKPDLLLLDIVMPKLGGYEVMQEMNKDKELKSIPVIIISNSGQPVEIEEAKKLGAKDWLIKVEFDPEEVLAKVIRQIGKA